MDNAALVREVVKAVERVRQRVAGAAFAEGLMVGLSIAALLAAVFIAAQRVTGVFTVGIPNFVAGALPPFAVAGVIGYFVRRRRVSPLQAALAIDARYGLKERITSAWLMRGQTGEFAALVQRDASGHIAGVRPGEVARALIHWDVRRLRFLAIPFALLAGALLLPNLDVLGIAGRRERRETERRLVSSQAERMRQEALRLAAFQGVQSDRPTSVSLAELSREMERLRREWSLSQKTAHDASLDAAELGEKFQKAVEQLQRESAAPRIDRPRPKESRFTAGLEQALKAGELEKAMKELEGLQAQAEGGDVSEEQRQAGAAELQSLAEAIKDKPNLSKSLGDAAKAMKAGDAKGASGKLSDAKQEVRKLLDAVSELAVIETSAAVLKSAQKELADAGGG